VAPTGLYALSHKEAVSEVILPLCKGELEGVEHHSNIVYPPSPSLTKGGDELRNSLTRGEGDAADILRFCLMYKNMYSFI